MDENWLQIREYEEEGFKPLIFFEGWRVCILRYLDELRSNNIHKVERHTETDEVFVLLKGKGVLIIGGNNPRVDDISPQVMEQGKLYNVRQNTWHTILLSRDASVLIVENPDTGEQNSEFHSLSEDSRSQILEAAKQNGID